MHDSDMQLPRSVVDFFNIILQNGTTRDKVSMLIFGDKRDERGSYDSVL